MEIFPENFRKQETTEINKNIKEGNCSLVIGMPGVGKSTFWHFLLDKLTNNNQKIILVDLNEVILKEENEIFDFLSSRLEETFDKQKSPNPKDLNGYEKFKYLIKDRFSNKDLKIIFILDRFEKILQNLPASNLEKFASLFSQFNGQLLFIFSVNNELINYKKEKDIDQFLVLVAPYTIYLKPYSQNETNWLIRNKGLDNLSSDEEKKIFILSGGHSQLIKSLIPSFEGNRKISIEQLLHNPAIKLQCERIWGIVFKSELPILKKKSERLFNFGILKKEDGSVKIFSQILEEFFKIASKNYPRIWFDEKTGALFIDNEQSDDILTEKEYLLLRYFYKHIGEIISRDTIAEVIWETTEGVSNEAIDQLVSRLRNKIEKDQKKFKNILTIFGRGYKFLP